MTALTGQVMQKIAQTKLLAYSKCLLTISGYCLTIYNKQNDFMQMWLFHLQHGVATNKVGVSISIITKYNTHILKTPISSIFNTSSFGRDGHIALDAESRQIFSCCFGGMTLSPFASLMSMSMSTVQSMI